MARLLIEAIDWGELRHLGPRFLALLHRFIVTSPDALCYVAERDGVVVGYAAWALRMKRFQTRFILQRGIPAALLLIPRLLRPRNLRPILKGVTYSGGAHADDPDAEMMFFAVGASGRRGGVGRKIFDAMLAELKRRGIHRLKAGTVAVENQAAIRFYEGLGFKYVRTDGFYADTQVHVYVLDVV